MRRSQVNKLIRELGHDPADVTSIEFRHDEIRVVYKKTYDDNMRWMLREFRHDWDENESGKIKLRDLRREP